MNFLPCLKIHGELPAVAESLPMAGAGVSAADIAALVTRITTLEATLEARGTATVADPCDFQRSPCELDVPLNLNTKSGLLHLYQ